jgi:hypothetical protein
MTDSLHSRVLVGVLAWLLARTGADAADGTQPLEESKRELKAMQNEQGLSKSGAIPAGEQPRFALPRLESAAPSAIASEPSKTTEPTSKQTRKDWLVDGMGLLKRDPKAKGAKADRAAGDDSESDTGAIDPSDPAYLLKTYEAQRAREATPGMPKTGARANDAVNPFASYMESWLVSGQRKGGISLKEETLGRRPSFGSDALGFETSGQGSLFGLGSVGGGAKDELLNSAAKGAAAANPYLADPSPGSSVAVKVSTPTYPTAPAPGAAFSNPLKPTNSLSADPPQEALTKTQRGFDPRTGKDDKKYFPPSKRF